MLVLAGAGTGKTRVITYRIAHLIDKGVPPGAILAVTFTNKAAGVMKDRISALLRATGRDASEVWVSTFHSFCARLLRRESSHLGLARDFAIYDDDDQAAAVKRTLAQLDLSSEDYPPRSVRSQISHAKNHGITPDEMESSARQMRDKTREQVASIFRSYNDMLRKASALDFDDLLLRAVELLRDHPNVRAAWSSRFRYVMVDEFQDTNRAQEELVRLLAGTHRNICVVGDEDQSIYGWRGAEIGNILRFEEDFPGAEVIRLEQNYRSTGHILGAASNLIARNQMRLGKNLWTSAEPGDKVRIQTLWDGEEEARWVADEIESLQRARVPLNEVAVMVRAGFQTRHFEERFITLGIPYRVLVGARFYERQEIRDAMAYLRLLASPEDDLAFERIINTPKRGVGPAALQELHNLSRSARIPLTEATLRLVETDELKPKLRATLQGLLQSFARWRELLKTLPHPEVAQIVLDESGYTDMWQSSKAPEAPGKLENIKELISALAEFDTLPAFLEHVSLVLETTDKTSGEQVTLMTLHGAKGLEFDIVFLPGWEEEIFPSRLALSENGNQGLEEERRLAYVGITRAKVRAFISHVANRHLHGSWINALPSRFIAELPDAHIERQSTIQGAGRAGGNAWQRGSRDDSRREKVPPLWDQLRAGQRRNSRTAPLQIEGKAHEIKPARREGKCNVGDRVFHEKFGTGTVRRVEHDKLEIAFDKAGIKKVMEGFVRAA